MLNQNRKNARTKLKLKRNQIILAFPGMGKTPLSIRNGKFRDVDFGTFRTGMGYTKENETKLLPKFRDYIAALDSDWENLVIMTNEPKLMKYIQFKHMYLPSVKGYRFCAKKMGVDVATIDQWVEDWMVLAIDHGVPVTFIDVGLDHYFMK